MDAGSMTVFVDGEAVEVADGATVLEAARAECAPFLEEARAHMLQLQEKNLLEAPTVEPRVILQIPDPERVALVLRIPVPGMARSRVEQAILRRYLSARTPASPINTAMP